MGDEIRVTVIAAGFDRWDDKRPEAERRPSILDRSSLLRDDDGTPDIFTDDDSDDLDIDSDDDFDVPSFLR